jgi:hypothetical protein
MNTTPVLEKRKLVNIVIDKIDGKNVRDILNPYQQSLEQFLKQLSEVIKSCEEAGFTNVRITSIEARTRSHFELLGDRLETDEELARRQARADGISKSKMLKKHKQLAQDLEILKKLQKEYGEDLIKLKVFDSDNES